jgi:hypothetical protein
MFYINAIPAGIFGTLVMTGALYLLTAITGKNFKVVGVLATMVTGHTTASKGLTKKGADLFIGIILHYCIGIAFALVYFFLWQHGIGNPDFNSSVLFGLITGCVATTFWSLFTYFHPDPPAFPRIAYVLLVGLSHVLFSLGVSAWQQFSAAL